MGDIKPLLPPNAGRSKPDGGEPAVVWKVIGPGPSRHGAISRQLSTYSHYKTWADKMRSAWKKDDAVAEEEETPELR